MIGDPLQRAISAMVIDAEHGRARHDRDPARGGQLGKHGGSPALACLAADGQTLQSQAARPAGNPRRTG